MAAIIPSLNGIVFLFNGHTHKVNRSARQAPYLSKMNSKSGWDLFMMVGRVFTRLPPLRCSSAASELGLNIDRLLNGVRR